MKATAWKHTAEAHPDQFKMTQDMMKGASQEQQDQATAYFHKNWESAPENPA